MLILYIVIVIFILSGIVFAYEIRHAEQVPPTEPFIYGDYDPKKDPIINHENEYCKKCKHFDGHDMCLAKNNFGAITNKSIINCKKEALFE